MGTGWKLFWNRVNFPLPNLEASSAHLLITSIIDAFIGTHFYRCNWICHEVDVAQLGDHNVGRLEWTVECRAQCAIDDENLSCQKILPDGLQFGRWCPEHNCSFSFETWKAENVNIEYARWYFFHVYKTHRALRRGVRVKSGAQFTTGLFAGCPLGSIVKRNSVSDEKAMRERFIRNSIYRSIVNQKLPHLLFLRTLKQQSTTFDKGNGSSVMKSTRSRLTLANTIISLNKSVQNCFTERPSMRDKSPPKIHCLPGTESVNGLHLVNTSRDSKSWSDSKGRPSPSGSIRPPPTVISR